jgi:hypothetical protein
MAQDCAGGVVIVEPRLIEKLWPQVWAVLQQPVESTGLETEQEVLDSLLSAKRFLIIVGDGVAVVGHFGKIFEINYMGGDHSKEWWPKMSDHIDQMAKAFGCEKIVAFGRSAWKRLAPDYEAKETRLYVKEVA